ncbi:hypothetical protein DFH06DRAFT_1146570 [Mycena polygramma]|nr:hypothetical protein DFH06DRAFT_1146570 [Mycena polygramma]
MAQPVLLRRLLPKPRSESFTLEMVQRATDSQSKPNRCSLAQQRRREREAQENTKPVVNNQSTQWYLSSVKGPKIAKTNRRCSKATGNQSGMWEKGATCSLSSQISRLRQRADYGDTRNQPEAGDECQRPTEKVQLISTTWTRELPSAVRSTGTC